jgi:hypothetical protein
LVGRPECGGECGTRGRACTLLPGGFGHHPLGTTTGVRGARWTTGQAGAGNTRSTDRPLSATSQEAWPEAELLEMKHSLGREPWWNADRCAPRDRGAAVAEATAEYQLRLSAFCFRFFSCSLSFFVARMQRSVIRGNRCGFDAAPGFRFAPSGLHCPIAARATLLGEFGPSVD